MNLSSAIARLTLGTLHLARALLGLALFAGTLMLAVILGLGVLIWALLRGRRPVATTGVWQRAAARRPFGGKAMGTPRQQGEVVDVEVREVASPDR
jgi:hypothetical protein